MYCVNDMAFVFSTVLDVIHIISAKCSGVSSVVLNPKLIGSKKRCNRLYKSNGITNGYFPDVFMIMMLSAYI